MRQDTPSDLNRDPPGLEGAGARTISSPAADKRPRDWKRSVLIAGLGGLSWVATYVGMLELIQANMGDLPFTHKIIIGFSVAMLMIMIIWLLDQIFRPHAFLTKSLYAFGYVYLSLISVGFGFGFYWKVLESRGEASRSTESAVGQVQSSLHAASTRLEQLQATLVQLTQVSGEKAELFNYQGNLNAGGLPANGTFDFEFAVCNSLTLGTQLGSTLTRSSVQVKNEVFSVSLDFGNLFGGTGNRYLEIRVKPVLGGSYTTLTPRTQLTATPYSVRSIESDSSATLAGSPPSFFQNAVKHECGDTAGRPAIKQDSEGRH